MTSQEHGDSTLDNDDYAMMFEVEWDDLRADEFGLEPESAEVIEYLEKLKQPQNQCWPKP